MKCEQDEDTGPSVMGPAPIDVREVTQAYGPAANERLGNQKSSEAEKCGGWICPKCGYVWAFWVAGCSHCNSQPTPQYNQAGSQP